MTAAAPSSRKVSAGSTTDAGVDRPAAVTTLLATDLSNASRQADGVDPTYATSASARIS
jgi:hypothetical protein